MDNQTWRKYKSRQRHHRLSNPQLNQSHPKIKIKASRRQPKDLHPAKIHLATFTLQTS